MFECVEEGLVEYRECSMNKQMYLKEFLFGLHFLSEYLSHLCFPSSIPSLPSFLPLLFLSFHLVFLLKYICIGAWTFVKSFPCFMWWLSLDTLFVPYRW